MSTKLIITESQLSSLKKVLLEMNAHEALVEKLEHDLNLNYEPMIGVVREDGEYFEEAMVKVKADETETTIRGLYEYFMKKYKLGEAFTQQVIKDWMFGKIKDNRLSKNVPIR